MAFMERYGCVISKENMADGTSEDCKTLANEIKLPQENVKKKILLDFSLGGSPRNVLNSQICFAVYCIWFLKK